MPNGLFNLKQQLRGIQQSAWTGQKTPAVNYLVVAGGGGGGGYYGAGGGGGGLLQGNLPVSAGSALTVTVGGGGAGSSNGYGTNGSNSIFSTVTSTGGGGGAGGSTASVKTGNSGGSGGGGQITNSTGTAGGGSGVFGQGNSGGSVTTSASNAGGGGGGAGTVSPVYNGGAGIASDISGTRTAYAGGGGGNNNGTAGTGGAGGGGSFNSAGTANTGGGGGGDNSSAGGSGIVIISYPDTYAAATSTTGSPTVSTSGSGSISFNGSSQFVYAPSSSNIANFSAGQAYTFECWFYQTSSPGCTITQGGTNTFSVAVTSSNGLNIGKSGVVDFIITSSSIFTNNTWVHLAISRNTSNQTRCWINGTSVGSTSSDTYAYNSANQYIGSNAAPGNYFPGYLSNVRFVKGTAVYDPTQTTITVPTAPLTAITNTSLLLNSISGAYLADSSGGAVALTASSTVPTWNSASPFTVTGYKNRVYTWTSSGSITF
jgi:hypothetical protein